MCRPVHPYASYLRYMQISSSQIFIIVEGKIVDPFFYSKICSRVSKDEQFSYKVVTARELPGASGGKEAVLGFFLYLRKRRSLVSNFEGKKTAAIFCVDKDVDDIQRKRKRSDHLIYTEHYDLYNLIFEHGDLVNGSAVAASIDPQNLAPRLSDASAWCLRAADKWREWVKFCLFTQKENINVEANYAVISKINEPLSGPVDNAKHSAFIKRIQRSSGLNVTEFRMRYARVDNRVNYYYSRGEHHKIFKGKWFSNLLYEEIGNIMAGRPYDSNSLKGRIPSSVITTLDFDEHWANHFKIPIKRIVSSL